MSPSIQPSVTRAGWLRVLARYCWRHRTDLIWSFGAAIVGSSIAAVTPLVARHIVDQVVGGVHVRVWPWAVLLLAAGLARFVASYTRRYRAGRLALSVQYDLRGEVLDAIQGLDGRRQDRLQTGQVVSRSISDLNLIQGVLSFLPILSGSLVMFLVALAVMLALSPMLTLVALAVGPALWFVARGSRRQLFPANWDAQNTEAEVAAQVEGAVTGVRVVKGFGQEHRELRRLAERARELFASRMRVVRLTAKWKPMLQAVPALGQVGVLAFGGWLALHGSVSLGTFLAFSVYLGQLVAPVRMLAGFLTTGQQARAGVDRVMEVIEQQPVISEPVNPVGLPAGPLGVELSDVCFSYEPSRPVLRGLDLRIEPGETVAVVAASGSGTSTMTQLLGRFYDVDAGAVRVGGVDVRQVSADELRRAVNVVLQDPFLFSDTLWANIAYARPEATDDEVFAAARAAAVDFADDLPDGFETVVGEQGLTLSGGQRQRVALARALLADPRVLVLDDTTSAVDPETEDAIHAALAEVGEGRTVLLVGHRRSTLALADRVVLLENGRITDSGTAEELEVRSDRFRQLMSDAGEDETTVDGYELDRELDGVTPEAWRRSAPETDGRRPRTRLAALSGGLGGGHSHAVATPELLALVDALPEAADDPRVDQTEAQAADPRFGLRRLLAPLKWPFAGGLALVAVEAGAQAALPWLVRHAVDSGVSTAAAGVLFGTVGVALAVVLGAWVAGAAQTQVTGRTGERLLYTLRVKTFAHLQRLGMDYYERTLGGRIMTRMTTDVDALSTFLQNGLATAVVSMLSLLVVGVAMVALDPMLALTVGSLLPVLIAATWWFRRRAIPVYTRAREQVSRVNAMFQECVAGLRVTQTFVHEERDAAKFAELSGDYRDLRLTAQRYIARFFPFIEFLSEVAIALVLWVGAARIEHGSLTAGVLIAFLLYVDLFFSPVQQLSMIFDRYQQAAVGLRRVSDLLRTPTSTPAVDHPLPVARLDGSVDFAGVGFRYSPDAPEALSALTVHVPPGQNVAVVGVTGAGKSSVMKLLARFYDPTDGAVRVDGQDLRGLDLTGYRQRLGYVPQEAFLFEGTVRDAIAYGRPDATDEEVEAAARRVGAHDMITRLAGGYLHQVGERGRSLSGGQRQLVALARAELVEPDLLLLDEATASLDLAAEAAVVRASERVKRRRTTVVVAHRLQTAARCERILVLDHGRLVEDGTHEGLLDAGGTYARLWAAYGGRRVTA